MKISIITVVYNNAATIETTIRSVLSQDYPKIEYIVIDGRSTDGTVGILGKYKDKISRIVSEPDNGIYDAMNKGVKLATGDVIGFLNSDDFYADETIVGKIVETMIATNVDCCYGDLEYVDCKNTKKVVRKWKSSPYRPGLFRTGWHPPHPTFFVKRQVYEDYGLFDLELYIAADYEIMLRFLERYGLKSYYIPRVLVKMRTGGLSNTPAGVIKANLEVLKAFKKNGYPICIRAFVMKPLSKILQYFGSYHCHSDK